MPRLRKARATNGAVNSISSTRMTCAATTNVHWQPGHATAPRRNDRRPKTAASTYAPCTSKPRFSTTKPHRLTTTSHASSTRHVDARIASKISRHQRRMIDVHEPAVVGRESAVLRHVEVGRLVGGYPLEAPVAARRPAPRVGEGRIDLPGDRRRVLGDAVLDLDVVSEDLSVADRCAAAREHFGPITFPLPAPTSAT